MRLTPFKLHRLRAGLLQIELANRTKIARCRLSEIECGHIKPRPDEVERIALALGVAITALVVTANAPEPILVAS